MTHVTRTRSSVFWIPLFIVLALIALVSYAHAQGTSPMESFWGGFRGPLLEVVSIIIAAFLSWLTVKLNTYFNMNLEEKDRKALQSALENAAMLVIDRALRAQQPGVSVIDASTIKDTGLDITKIALNVGIDYVRDSVPDAVKRFGLDDLFIDKLLRPHLNKALTSIIR